MSASELWDQLHFISVMWFLVILCWAFKGPAEFRIAAVKQANAAAPMLCQFDYWTVNANLIGNSAAPKKAVAAATVFFFVALELLEKLNFSVCDVTWGILPQVFQCQMKQVWQFVFDVLVLKTKNLNRSQGQQHENAQGFMPNSRLIIWRESLLICTAAML